MPLNAIRVNDRDKVLQITYVNVIESLTDPNPKFLGLAAQFPDNDSFFLDGKNKVPGLKLHYRLTVDDRARLHTLLINEGKPVGQDGKTWGLLLGNRNGIPSDPDGNRTYGSTLAHEVGHVLALRHRDDRLNPDDGLIKPGQPNLMFPSNKFGAIPSDLDLGQCIAIGGSHVFK